MTKDDLREQLIRHEGMRLKPYRCAAGKLTIGVGRNLDDNGITESEAKTLLDSDMLTAVRELYARYPFVVELPEARFYALVNMCFNLGITRLMGFKKMWAALEQRDYEVASIEALNSKWADQVGSRADELAEQLRTGIYKEMK